MKSIRNRLRALPAARFDQLLPRKLQHNPADYDRRSKRTAAVAVPLCHLNQQLSVLLTVRSDKTGSHKGQVSFPGGHIDGNETPEQAAVRELEEETGLGDFQVLGRWHPTRAVTGTMVTPVVGYVGELTAADIDRLQLSEEVVSCFAASVQQLREPGGRKMEVLQGRWTMPRWEVLAAGTIMVVP